MGEGLAAALHAEMLNRVRGVGQSGGVYQDKRDAVDIGNLFDRVTGCAGDGCDYGPVVVQEAVEEARLADIRTPHYRNPDAVAVYDAGIGGANELADSGGRVADCGEGVFDGDVVVREVDARG